MTRAVVSLKSGSSSIKFGLYELDPNGAPVLAVRGKIERIGISPRLSIRDSAGGQLLEQEWPITDNHELDPPNIVLTPSAKRAWVALYNDIEKALGGDGDLAPIRSLASKAPEHITRMRCTFGGYCSRDTPA